MSCKRTYANPRSKGGNPLGKCPSTTSCTTHHFGYTDASSCTNNHYLTVTAGDTENPQDSNNPPQKIYYNRNDRLHFYGDTNIEVTVVDEEGNIQQSRTIVTNLNLHNHAFFLIVVVQQKEYFLDQQQLYLNLLLKMRLLNCCHQL